MISQGSGVLDTVVNVGPDWIECSNASSLFLPGQIVNVLRNHSGVLVSSFVIYDVKPEEHRLIVSGTAGVEQGDYLVVSDASDVGPMELEDYDPPVHVPDPPVQRDPAPAVKLQEQLNRMNRAFGADLLSRFKRLVHV